MRQRSLARIVTSAAAFAVAGCGGSPASNAPDAGTYGDHPIPNLGRTAGGALGARADVVVEAVTSADSEFLWERPELAAGKYAIMAMDPFAFFRGSLALFLRDWNDPAQGLSQSRFRGDGPTPLGLGDAHLENFGTMRTAQGVFRVEPNDFDTADRVPYLWDVRRFAVSMCLAARTSNPSAPSARDAAAAETRAIVRAGIASYASTVAALAAGGPPPKLEAGQVGAVLEDLFARSVDDWDRRAELGQLTMASPVRAFIRGTPDPAQPIDVTKDLPAHAAREVSRTLAEYRGTLPVAPPSAALISLDAVQAFGQGVGSFPRVRVLVLVRGATVMGTDDVVLELKELPRQGTLPLPVPTMFESPRRRVAAALAAGWTEPGADPGWGVGTWSGMNVQLRTRAAGFKTVRVARLDGNLGTPAAISGLGADLARLVARMHASPAAGDALAASLAREIGADPEAFADEQTDAALAYCDQVVIDWMLFKQALAALGPTLGVAGTPAHAPTADLRVLYDPPADPRAAGVDPLATPVGINEIAGGDDFIELLNVGATAASLAGFALTDEDSDGGPRLEGAVRFGATTTLPPRGRLVVAGGEDPADQGLSAGCPGDLPSCVYASWSIDGSRGERAFLLSPDDVIVDSARVSPEAEDNSWARLPDGSGPFALGAPTPGRTNRAP